MKKIIALLMVMVLAVSLAACVPTPSDVTDIVENAFNNIGSDNETKDNDADDDYDLDINIGDNDVDINIGDDTTAPTVAIDFNSNMAEQVIYNKGNIKVTASELTYKEYYGPTLSLLVENESDKNVTVSTQNLCVNNMVFSSYLYADVNSGKKVYEDLHLYESDLKNMGITAIGTIEFTLDIYETDTYDDIDESDVIKLVIDYKVSVVPVISGDKLFSKNGFSVYAQAPISEDDDYYTYVKRLLVVNESNKNVYVRCQDVSVNGFMIDPYCSTTVPAGKAGYTNLYFSNDELEKNKIKSIEEVELYFAVQDSDTYDEICKSDVLTLTK